MGIEWFRDLSITLMGFMATAMLIFVGVVVFILYRQVRSVLRKAKSIMTTAQDMVSLVQEAIKPLIPVLTLIQGIRGGLSGLGKTFAKH